MRDPPRWRAVDLPLAGEVTTDAELQLLVKTTASRVDDAIARIVALHPYELPECIAVETRAGLRVSGLDPGTDPGGH